MENGSTSMLTVIFVELKCLSDGFTRKKVKEEAEGIGRGQPVRDRGRNAAVVSARVASWLERPSTGMQTAEDEERMTLSAKRRAAILWRNGLYIESQLRAFRMYKLSADMPASPFSPTACTQNRALTAFVCTSCSPYNLPRAIDSFPQVRCGACLRTPNQIPDRNAWRIRK